MCEILVKARTNNPKKSIGDVVTVKPNGWKWGKEENLPRFVVIKVPNMSVEEARSKYMERLFNQATHATIKHRKKHIDIGDAIGNKKSVITISKKQLEDKVKTKN